jgi:hypothetical protein
MDRLLRCAVLLAGAACGGAHAADSPLLLWADFKETLQSHSGATVLPLAMSDRPGDVVAEPLRVRDGQVWVEGRLTNANGGQWATLGMEVPGQAGATPVDLSGYQHLRIRLSSAAPRLLRIRLKGSDPRFLNTGCYPVMLQRVGPQPTDYVVPLGAFEPQPWCAGRGLSVEQTLPAVVSVEVTANEPETEPVRYTVGRIEFLRPQPAAAAALPSAPRVARDPGWALAWADEFDAPAGQVADPTRWWVVPTHQPARAATSRDAWHDGLGHLAVRLREADVPAGTRLQVKPTAAMMLGRVEAQFKAPERAGLSASLSLLGAPLAALPWPEAGEIVLLETQARGPATLGLYGPGLEGDTHLAQPELPRGEARGDGFHEIAVEWEPARIRWWLDGVLAKTQLRADLPPAARAVFGQWPFLLTLALTSETGVPGALPQAPDGADAHLLIDHVRVYQRDDLAAAVRPRLAAWQAQRSAMAAPAHGKQPQPQAPKRKPPAEPGGPPKPVRQVTCERNERYGLILCH